MHVKSTISLFLVCLFIGQAVAQKDDGLEDYGPEPGLAGDDPNAPKDGKSGGDLGPDGDPNKPLDAAEEEDKSKTKFSDDRFAKLFPARAGGRSIMPKATAKPKPTLPSFIKSTPPLIKAQVVTTPTPRGGLNRARAIQQQPTTRRGGVSTTTTPRPNRNRGALGNTTPRQLSGRLTTSSPSRPTSAPSSQSAATPSAAALAASRRLRQGSGISRFQRTNNNNNNANTNANANNNTPQAANSLPAPNNSTIPALNPRRN